MGRPASRRMEPARNQPPLPRAQRRARGIYYTPPEIVRELVRLTLDGLLTRSVSEASSPKALRILDPACGAGAMLAAASAQWRGRRALELFGVDSDPQAVRIARATLSFATIWQGDALFDRRLDRLAPFDAIVGNPPYVNIRQLAKSVPAAQIERLRHRFRTARGNFDLYVPFIERALELLSPGGRCGLVIPNKWATLDYARPLRELLLAETTIQHVVDLSAERVFAGANVYPHLLVFTRRAPAKSHAVQHRLHGKSAAISQRMLSPAAISFAAPLDVESRVKTRPLGELAVISCGTPGYSARRVADALRNATEGVPYSAHVADFITSGNIDRYEITRGNVRFLGKLYQRPKLPLDSPALTDRQRRLFAGEKIVVAGLSQRLEAAWDERGLALGVQVFALSEWQIDPHYLLALLNSKLLSFLFRTRFAAKRLAGGYVAINKGQLAQLPIALPRKTSVALVKLGPARRLSNEEDARIDRLVYRLYRQTEAEIATVETHFAQLGRRAA
ncbi:MAG: N-6 DNA methylase [Planctomycetaceae bacterium]|nr:N-6 DNA methylase [Planctomycetaceae bacterium]